MTGHREHLKCVECGIRVGKIMPKAIEHEKETHNTDIVLVNHRQCGVLVKSVWYWQRGETLIPLSDLIVKDGVA